MGGQGKERRDNEMAAANGNDKMREMQLLQSLLDMSASSTVQLLFTHQPQSATPEDIKSYNSHHVYSKDELQLLFNYAILSNLKRGSIYCILNEIHSTQQGKACW